MDLESRPEPAHDVVVKCPNGKKKLPTASIYVVIRINLQGPETDADVIAYSYDQVHLSIWMVFLTEMRDRISGTSSWNR